MTTTPPKRYGAASYRKAETKPGRSNDAIPSALARRAATVTEHFHRHFGRTPRWLVAAPGRVNLIGEHTDYNGGFVLPMAIERYTFIAADHAPERDDAVHLFSRQLDEQVIFSWNRCTPWTGPAWTNYPRGAWIECAGRGLNTGAIDALIDSDVPLGGGLSSSAALEVATATLIETITRSPLDPLDKALLCQKVEHDYAGVPCGVMDQYVSVFAQAGQLLLIDCRALTSQPVAIRDPAVSIMVVNSNVRHEHTSGEYADRRAQCEQACNILNVASLRDVDQPTLQRAASSLDPVVFQRARHVVMENDRTLATARAIEAGDWRHVGELMYESHRSLREDYEVSCRELDLLVNLARDIGVKGGVFGARMTGGGFGGCTVNLVRTSDSIMLGERFTREYQAETGLKPDVFTTRPARGAHVITPRGD